MARRPSVCAAFRLAVARRGDVIERVVLVGFTCSGKTAVGRLLAAQLDWDFVDFDLTIEQREQRRISQIFRQDGESHYRNLEAQLTQEVEGRHEVVLAPGSGWIAQPGLFERLRSDSLYVWLRVQPETVFSRQRVQASVGGPTLAAEPPLDSLRLLMADRAALYGRADTAVDTDGRDPTEVARQIAGMLAG
jgi:shikimate kinase